MAFQYLLPPRLHELFQALTEAKMVRVPILEGLLEGIDAGFVSHLPEDTQANVRLLKTLNRLNEVERLTDGTVPFITWLNNAALLAAPFPNTVSVLSRALADVSSRSSDTRPAPGFRGKLPQQQERIVHQDDTLPFSFLKRGADAGSAVARLAVTRYENGSPVLNQGNSPVLHLGTGWLLTPDLLITNHHVINARGEGEPNASPTDLVLQAKNTIVQFDYDEAGTAGTDATVSGLAAVAFCDGPLDYAILRLKDQLTRTPLRVCPTAFALASDPDKYPAVNIIQHPQGHPKRIACRNNLVTRVQGVDLWYFTDTMAGSSGSPVLDDQWRVVALHKKWDFVEGVNYQGKATAWANVGTLMSAVLEDLAKSSDKAARDLHAEILRRNGGGAPPKP